MAHMIEIPIRGKQGAPYHVVRDYAHGGWTVYQDASVSQMNFATREQATEYAQRMGARQCVGCLMEDVESWDFNG